MPDIPAIAPVLSHFCRITAEVDPVVTVGDTAYGVRRFVPITGGTVIGESFSGQVMGGGVDWQIQRSDGVLDIAAHYVIRTGDGTMIEVQSNGYRHGPADVMSRLARGEAVAPDEYYFRTAITFRAGAPKWQHLNAVIAIGKGMRTPDAAIIDVYLV